MALTDIKNDIVGFSSDQKKFYNQTGENKIYNESSVTLTAGEEDDVTTTMEAVEALTDTDFATLQSMLPSGKKLSNRPC